LSNENGRILWVNFLAGSSNSEVPEALKSQFDVREVRYSVYLGDEVSKTAPLCIFYDCDYLDAKRLSRINAVRSANPSISFVVATLQHSESLAVWAFRQGALDFLIKPLNPVEIEQCIRRLKKIAEFKFSPQTRPTHKMKAAIPETLATARVSSQDNVGAAVCYVQHHYNERIYSDAVARLCGLSPTYFSKAFHKRYKMPFQEFLLRYRIARACHLLENPNVSISDVAFAVGFRDPSYFTRTFRRYFGIPPSEHCSTAGSRLLTSDLLPEIESSLTSSSQVVRALAAGFSG
jgi:AraC-like DNA-binding protein